jgi:hypothetical protein
LSELVLWMARLVLKRDEVRMSSRGRVVPAGTYFVPKARKASDCCFFTTRQQDREANIGQFKVAEKQLVDG